MKLVYLIGFFVLGTVMGSFFNVLGLRIPKKESIVKPRSHCDKCGHILSWYEMIPILSYFILKGKCRSCETHLSLMYPLSELFCGILFAVSFYSFGFSYELLIALIISCVMIMVLVSDLSYMIIPDSFIVIPSIMLLLIKLIGFGWKEFLYALISGLISFVIMYMIMKIGTILLKKEALGGADVKLMFLVGICVFPFLSLIVIIFASFIALPVSIFLLVKKKEKAIPFGPFIMLGLLIVFFTKMNGQEIINFILHL